jgi:hypothetical protein
MDSARAHYDDGSIACDDDGLAIQRYYPWGARRIPYREIRNVRLHRLSGWSAVQKLSVWGPADLVHWWNYDPQRPHRDVAVVIDTGSRIRPTVTPADPAAFERIVRAHLVG